MRAERIADLRAYLAEVTQEELDRVRGPNTALGCPPPGERTAAECLRVIFSDEWAHVQFANRDLAILEEQQYVKLREVNCSGSVGPGEVGGPVGFPGLAAVERERLLPPGRRSGDA